MEVQDDDGGGARMESTMVVIVAAGGCNCDDETEKDEHEMEDIEQKSSLAT